MTIDAAALFTNLSGTRESREDREWKKWKVSVHRFLPEEFPFWI